MPCGRGSTCPCSNAFAGKKAKQFLPPSADVQLCCIRACLRHRALRPMRATLPGVAAARVKHVLCSPRQVGIVTFAPFRVVTQFELRMFPALPMAQLFGWRQRGRAFFASCRPSMSPTPAWQSSSRPAGYAGDAREETRWRSRPRSGAMASRCRLCVRSSALSQRHFVVTLSR
jgi:hypothetical protein